MRPPATGRPARSAPRSPRALVPVDAATQAPGPGLSPRAAASCQPQVPRPAGGPRQARRHPCACAPRSLACMARSPPARPPTPLCGAPGASADRRQGRPHLPATATGPAPARRRLRLGRPPLPMRAAPASAPRQRNLLTAGPSARRGTRTGARRRPCARAPRSLACGTRPPPARPPTPLCAALRATADRRLDRPHPHGAASASAARRYPCARPGPRPPAGCAARPPVSRAQGQAPGDST